MDRREEGESNREGTGPYVTAALGGGEEEGSAYASHATLGEVSGLSHYKEKFSSPRPLSNSGRGRFVKSEPFSGSKDALNRHCH